MAFITRLLRLHIRRFSSEPNRLLTSKPKTRAVLSLLKTEQNPEKIIDICRSASLTPDFHVDRIAFSLAISNLTDSKSYDTISSFLEELKHRADLKNERFHSHSMILYGQAGMHDHAVKTFKELKHFNITPTRKSLNALLASCLMSKNYTEVSRMFYEYSNEYGILPDLETYNLVIKAHCESGNAISAYSVLEEMHRNGWEPNEVTFGTILAGFYAEEKYEHVRKFSELMEERYEQKPSLSTYNFQIQSLCKLKKTSEAKVLFEGLVAKGFRVNVTTYRHLIYGFAKEGNLEEMKEIFDEMKWRGCEPDNDVYFTYIYYLCQGRDFETALKACKRSIVKKWYPNFSTMKMLIEGLVSISRVEEARKLVAIMKRRFSKNDDMWKEVEEGLPR